MELGTC